MTLAAFGLLLQWWLAVVVIGWVVRAIDWLLGDRGDDG